MNKNISYVLFFIFLVFSNETINAQSKKELSDKSATPKKLTWEFGPMMGFSFSQNDMANLSAKETHPAGAFLLRKQVNQSFALRAQVVTGTISGNDKNRSANVARGYTFESPVNEFSLLAEYDFFGKRRNPEGIFKKMWSPYLFTGIGIALTNPKIDFNEKNNPTQAANIAADKANAKKRFNSLPLGVGVKYSLSEKMTLYAESGLRLVFSDYLDGISLTASPKQNDTYTFTGVGITFKLGGNKDTDGDGITDALDICPDIAGAAQFKGCPDTDEDGIEDAKDKCPTEKGTTLGKGCPDTDGDGVVDTKDECPSVAGVAEFKGCPDTDGDGIEDKKDRCPKDKGSVERKGCPFFDRDNDGIEDYLDKCPSEKGTPENSGCPIKDEDRDKDGIVDKNDLCPDKAGSEKFNGCPDTDSDGVEDMKDNCPTEAGTIANQGCPETLKVEDQKVLSDALYGVDFEVGSAIIKESSYGILNQIVALMNKYPSYALSISGHTDNVGKEADNQTLSLHRARACYDYLARQSVVTNRMKYTGYGSSSPIGDNNTPYGRRQNRRVEFALKAN